MKPNTMLRTGFSAAVAALCLAALCSCVQDRLWTSATANHTANGVRIDGAQPGEWTHDWDAAVAAAKEDGTPVFVNFTGSDWCFWCDFLKRQVFSQPEWHEWASTNVYLVHLDFPHKTKLVPAKYRGRNRELSERYGVTGYPTCFLLDPASLEPLGRFGASRNITVSAFIERVADAMPGEEEEESGGFVNGVRVDGAAPGEWTHDWDAAAAAAAADGKPVFVNFTGSDWCHWCEVLQHQVFDQPEWSAWAATNVYLVHIDHPRARKLVPAKYRVRNKELMRRYKVDGVPTCYLLAPATLEPLGQFGASPDATAAAFVEEVAAAMPGAEKAEAAAGSGPDVSGDSPEDDAGGFVNGIRVDGAVPGEWTHDWDAAVAAAKADGKPVFVNFTGSDWCGWCKLLKRKVFAEPEWSAWAGRNVYLVHLDFPSDKELVPEKYRTRNRELASRYKVGGYPTCYLLDPATLEPLGRFGASRDVTAAAFVRQVSAAMPGAEKAGAADGGPETPVRW